MTSRRDLAVGYCKIHEKLSYANRDDAKKIGRRHHPRKTAFRCEHSTFEAWHVGSLPVVVKKGMVNRGEIYRKAA